MKSLLPNFNRLTPRQITELWTKGLFVFDANSLISITAFGKKERENALSAIRLLDADAWIPHIVAVEFAFNKSARINAQKSAAERWTKDVRDSLQKTINVVTQRRNTWGITAEADKFVLSAQKLQDEFDTTVGKSVTDFACHIEETGEKVFEEIDKIFCGEVGDAPKTQDDLNRLAHDSDTRFKRSIPPGYMDAKKDDTENPYQSFSGLAYKKSHGDLILWRQLLDFAASSGRGLVTFVTDDLKKGDWTNSDGHARHELRDEAYAKGVLGFQIVSLEHFLSGLNEYRSGSVVETTLIAARETHSDIDVQEIKAIKPLLIRRSRTPTMVAQNAVCDWLRTRVANFPASNRIQNEVHIALPSGDTLSIKICVFRDFSSNALESVIHQLIEFDHFKSDFLECILVVNSEPHEADLHGFQLSETLVALAERLDPTNIKFNSGQVIKGTFHPTHTSFNFVMDEYSD